jgi:hypothetical protein
MRPCPHCTKQIKDDVEICKHCLRQVPKAGESLPESDAVKLARASREAGARLFQIAIPLSQTEGFAVNLSRAVTTTTTTEHGSVLEAIEAEGWRLENANYVYRITGSVSRDKWLSSGQQEAVSGEIVGVYLFRRTSADLQP